jgi:hypothetical protein
LISTTKLFRWCDVCSLHRNWCIWCNQHPGFVPINDISYPSGATHISLKSAYANVDFTNEISAIEYSPVTNLPIDGTNTPVTLTPAGVLLALEQSFTCC